MGSRAGQGAAASDAYLHAVVCKHEAFGQAGVGVVVQPNVVGAVGEERLPRPDTPRERHRFICKHVRMMLGTETQGVHDKRLYAFKGCCAFVADALHVCDICQPAEAEGGDRQRVVHHAEGRDWDVADAESVIVLYGMEMQARHAGIEMLGKDVWHRLVKAADGLPIGINRYVAESAEGPQVVQTAHMVVVYVCQQNAVDAPEIFAQHLLADVRAAVNQNARRL